MRLISDFRDYYDFAFSNTGEDVVRWVTGGPDRREQHRMLREMGYTTPRTGTVKELFADRVSHVVAYEDLRAHRGEGKRLFSRGSLRSNPHMGMPGGDRFYVENALYAAEFVGDPYARPSVSWRRLQIGTRVYWVEYTSQDSWMSNVGEGTCSVVGEERAARGNYPLFAVDFVIDRDLLAVDLNVAPGIRGSGVEHVLDPFTAVEELERWFHDPA